MKNVLLLFGGNSPEHEVSCQSARSILENIDTDKFMVTAVGVDKNNEWYIYNDSIKNIESWLDSDNLIHISNVIDYLKSFDIVFPIIHGVTGEDGKLQGLLDFFSIKYVGSNSKSSANCMDKATTKILYDAVGIPQIPSLIIYDKQQVKEVTIEYPVIVKPANGGSSIGVNLANDPEELNNAIDMAFSYDKKIIIEKFINALELECAVLEQNKTITASTVGQIIPCNKFYDYEAKYIKESKLIIPAQIDDDISKKVRDLSIKAFKTIEAKDMARVDFLYDIDNKKLYLSEINTLPGFTIISMYPKLLINDGISYTDLLTILIDNNLKNTKDS